jgi:hypothetical protein
MCHAIRARPSSIASSPTIWRPFSFPLTPTPMRKACPPMWNANYTTTCNAASSLTALRGWAVTPASTRCCWPSAASGGGFVRRVPGGAWPRPRPTWLSRSFPGCRHGNGLYRCLSPCGIGWRLHRTSLPESIRSFAPQSVSITLTKQSNEVLSGPTSNRDRSPLSNALAAP